MFTDQINALKEKEELIMEQIKFLEETAKGHRDDLNVVRRGLKSMQRLQEQLCDTPENPEQEQDIWTNCCSS